MSAKVPHPVGKNCRNAIFSRLLASLIVSLGCFLWAASPASANSRIKDIVDIENVRENQLIGYGLVVGLPGSGDSVRNSPFTQQSLQAMLERLGVNIRDVNMSPANVAAVSVTAVLPPFARRGSRIDVQISALGDAENLQGGTLLLTPLVGLDGEIYAVAQGAVAVSGFLAAGEAETVARGVTTAARISSGAIVEREIAFDFGSQRQLKLALRNPDFTTARRIAQTINRAQGPGMATALDPSTVQLLLTSDYSGNMVDLIGEVEQLEVRVDQPARIVIDEASGTIVMGADVKISKVAIAQGNLNIRVTETPQVSQPAPFAQGGETAVVPRTQIDIDDDSERRLAVLNEAVSLQDLVDGLNALGVGPRDLISILMGLKAAGALQAEVEVY